MVIIPVALKIIFIVFSAMMLVLPIIGELTNTGINAILCPECPKDDFVKAVVRATAGADDTIGKSVERLKITTSPSEIAIHRMSILGNLFVIFIGGFIIAWTSLILLPGAKTDMATKLVAIFLIPFLVLFIVQIIGTWILYEVIKIPFSGLVNLMLNPLLLIKTGGFISELPTGNFS